MMTSKKITKVIKIIDYFFVKSIVRMKFMPSKLFLQNRPMLQIFSNEKFQALKYKNKR